MNDSRSVFISSPIAALVEGIYHSTTTLRDLRKKGNMGIGTFNGLDGEMVYLDGKCFCLRPNMEAIEVDDDVMTPFAMCIDFAEHMSEGIDRQVPVTQSEAVDLGAKAGGKARFGRRAVFHFGPKTTRKAEKPVPLNDTLGMSIAWVRRLLLWRVAGLGTGVSRRWLPLPRGAER